MSELSTVFIGRETEIQCFLEIFNNNPRTFQALLVTASSGLGKTALLQEVARKIHTTWPEAVVLFGGCEEQEPFVYKAFAGVLNDLSRWLATLSREECLLLMHNTQHTGMRVLCIGSKHNRKSILNV